jgi:hypothetical protein
VQAMPEQSFIYKVPKFRDKVVLGLTDRDCAMVQQSVQEQS